MSRQTRHITGTRRTADNNTFIILSAGTGRRTKNYGNKSLIPYGNKRIIDHQVETIRSAYGANTDIVLVTGYMSDKVIRDVITYLSVVHFLHLIDEIYISIVFKQSI